MTAKEPDKKNKPEAEAQPEVKEPKAEAAAKEPEKAEKTEAAEPSPPPEAPEPPPLPPPSVGERRDFWDTAATYLKKAKDEVVRSSRVGKLRLDIARIRKQRKDLFSELGDQAYELMIAGNLTAEALDELKVAVDEKSALIAAKDAEIEAITAEEAEEEAEGREESS